MHTSRYARPKNVLFVHVARWSQNIIEDIRNAISFIPNLSLDCLVPRRKQRRLDPHPGIQPSLPLLTTDQSGHSIMYGPL